MHSRLGFVVVFYIYRGGRKLTYTAAAASVFGPHCPPPPPPPWWFLVLRGADRLLYYIVLYYTTTQTISSCIVFVPISAGAHGIVHKEQGRLVRTAL